MIFWHIPSEAYKEVAPRSGIPKPCVGSINEDEVEAQKAETGIMKLLEERTAVKVRTGIIHIAHSCKQCQNWIIV